VSIAERHKSRVESQPTGSKIRGTQRRPVRAAVVGLRVHAAELPRRKFLHLATGVSALAAVSRLARAQAYPTRPITMIVPAASGGQLDAVARVIAEQMRKTLGQPVIIENVSGGDGTIATGRVARAVPDGYTIDLGNMSTHVLNGAFYSLRYSVLNDFARITPLVTITYVIYARKTMPHPA
jgi:tripartite-type tricarboxylate transporter receptor subunit TctC